jgi:hypothetical protein
LHIDFIFVRTYNSESLFMMGKSYNIESLGHFGYFTS